MDANQDRLGKLYAELSRLIGAPKVFVDQAMAALVAEHGAEDVTWTLKVLAEDMGAL